jgi:hypothetical protein
MLTHSYGCNPIAGLWLNLVRIMLHVSGKLGVRINSLMRMEMPTRVSADIHEKQLFAEAVVCV